MATSLSPHAEYNVVIPCQDAILEGDLTVPVTAKGLVIFAHGSGSSRKSPRNRSVAWELNQKGLATLLVCSLSQEESALVERADVVVEGPEGVLELLRHLMQ